MNRKIKFGIFLSAFVFSSQVFAGRDELQLLRQDKQDKAALAAEARNGFAANQEHQLDHGPRATTSLWINQSEHIGNLNESPSASGLNKNELKMTKLEVQKRTGG